MSFNKTFNYSPNFDEKKRDLKKIKFLIFHYTGMKKESEAINRLTDFKSKVSSHYLIKNNGEIITLVPELYIAWHCGVSFWKNYKSINKYSIGVEISNPGHNFKYKTFSKKVDYIFQMKKSTWRDKIKTGNKFVYNPQNTEFKKTIESLL